MTSAFLKESQLGYHIIIHGATMHDTCVKLMLFVCKTDGGYDGFCLILWKCRGENIKVQLDE